MNELLHNDSVPHRDHRAKTDQDETTGSTNSASYRATPRSPSTRLRFWYIPTIPTPPWGPSNCVPSCRQNQYLEDAGSEKGAPTPSASYLIAVVPRIHATWEEFLEGGNFPPNCYATNSNADVIDYVATHPNAPGHHQRELDQRLPMIYGFRIPEEKYALFTGCRRRKCLCSAHIRRILH